MADKDPLKVVIDFLNGESKSAYVYLEDEQRLQDLVNDSRHFLPVYFMIDDDHEPRFKCVMINKTEIHSIEEWDTNSDV